MDGRREKTNVFCLAVDNKVIIAEVDVAQNPVRVQGDIVYTDPNDVPIAMQYSERFGLHFLISAMGILSGFDITTGTHVVMSKLVPISVEPTNSSLNNSNNNSQCEMTWKITPLEELGNFVRQFDCQFALAIYLSCKSHANAAQIMCELGEFEKVVQYCKMTEYKVPFFEVIRVLAGVNPAGALADPGEIMEIFYQRDLIKELTDVIYDYLTNNDPSISRLQTRYLEILLQNNTQAADFILGKKAFDQYDPPYIASCCEQAGLYHRALEHRTEKPDILRCIVYTNKIPHDFVIAYLHEVTIKVDRLYGYECIKALVKNMTNLNLVEICIRCMAELGASELIEILEQGGMVEGVYLFLQGVASHVQDKDIVFRFIQAAVKMGQFKDVERVVRESNAYDPKQVKDFLKESKGDPQALIIVCDKHDYIEEMIKYLYQNNFHKAIERYCTGYNPKATPKVVGALIDCEANEEFINALLGMVKIKFLEVIVLRKSEFASIKKLQNLLLITAIKAESPKVKDYICRLDNYDGEDVAKFAVIDHIGDIERANDLAVTVNLPSCWTLLAKGELTRDMVEKCISSYIMARRLKEQVIDSELVYSFARTDQLAEIEEFIGQSNLADLQAVGDRCYDEEMYNAARILFNHIGNFGKLTQTLSAQSIRTWKEVYFACVDARQFRLAQMCGVNIVVQVDELATLIDYYTERGHYDEIIQLMEYALRLKHTHMDMFTELGILYSKYKPKKLMEHIKMFHSRINVPQLLGICEANLQWAELCLLHTHYDDFDKAVQKMLEHIDAWSHSQFKDIVIKVTNTEILYRAIDAYLQQHPLLVCDLLTVMSPQLDHSRVVQQLRRKDRLALCKPFLLFVQGSVKPEVPEVNEAVNELYVEEEDVDALRLSIAQYPSFDQLGLARNLEKHHLLRMRRVASLLFTQNKRFAHAVELAKKDKMYQDAMEASAASKDVKVCEELLRFLANDIDENERAGCFAAALYICFEFLTEDIVMEVAWEANLEEYAKPFQVQQRRNSENKINELEKTVMELKKKLEAKEEEEKQAKVTELQQYPPQMTRSQGMVSTMGAPMNQPMNK
ncbi:putative Clathrin heavy chain [Blattamonas nauphoetae]|uniref:Clathrin heavy chain n=1 Tax=Blattamonas nauphoetae TaxID=2049346 RepID=A0ABQ9YHD9_9EUKA|nr:putative Clathrin heavy chain [Blattamonas nauphoetae]